MATQIGCKKFYWPSLVNLTSVLIISPQLLTTDLLAERESAIHVTAGPCEISLMSIHSNLNERFLPSPIILMLFEQRQRLYRSYASVRPVDQGQKYFRWSSERTRK
jgi:hypothetical protein